MEKCPGLIDATKETVVLVIELAEKTVLNSPEMIKKILEDDKVQKEIKKILTAEAKRFSKKQQQGKNQSLEDSKKLGRSVGKSFADTASSHLKKQILHGDEYRKVKHSVKQLQCSFNNSPVGVFIDKNKGWLIIIASGLAVGAATAMYVFREGDFVANAATKLAGKALRFKVLGNIKMGAKIDFKPSARQVGTTVFTEINWKHIKLNFDWKIRAKEDKFDTTAASALIIANLTKKLSLRASAGIGYKRPEKVFYQPLIYNAKFGLRYNFRGPNLIIEGMAFMKQTPKYRKVGGGGSLNYKFGGGSLYSPGGSLSLTGKGSRTETFQSRGPNQAKTDYTVKFEFKLRF